MIDTRNGESYDGELIGCDNYMNLKLNDVTITSSDGKFFKSKEVFIRGNNIKSI
jgi:U6 snRNA-associated Sm-like protein LSm4